MKILHVIRGMANSSGTTHIVGPLAAAQSRQGASVSIYCCKKGAGAPVLPDAGLVDSRCFELSLPFDNPGVSAPLARALNAGIERFDAVHVHAVWNFPSWWSMKAARQHGVPYMVAPQGSFDPWALRQNRLGKRIYGALTEVPCFHHAARMQALTRKEARQIREYGIDVATEIIPNGIDRELLDRPRQPDPAWFGLPAASRTLLFLSRIHPKKGLDLLVDAVSRIRERVRDLNVVVAGGDGGSGYLKTIRDRCVRQGVADRFVFTGEVGGTEKLETLAAANAFILPSYSEGLPVAVIEALGAGLPVIVSDQCNLPEIDEHGAGLVVPPETARVAEAITRLFDMPPRQLNGMGENARKLARESFIWDGIAEKTLNVYETMIRETASSP